LISAVVGASEAASKSLADIYRKGSIKLVSGATIDESKLPKDVFFQGVTDVKCDPQGNIYVCDFQANHILKFDGTGKYLKSIGRQGQGPGEFNMPYHIAVTADRLFVYDMRNSRLSALTLDGTFVKSVPLITGEGRPEDMSSLPGGDIVFGWETIFFGDRSRPQEYSIRIYSPDLTLRKKIYSRDIWRNKFMDIGGRFSNIIQPFSPVVSWDVTADGKIVVGDQKDYEVEILDLVKGKMASLKKAHEPVKVTAKDKEEFFAGITYGSPEGGVTQGAPDSIVKNTEFPRDKPPYYNLAADSDGNILVFPHRKNKVEEWKYFEAFSPDGKFIGAVKIEGAVSMPRRVVIRDGAFWATSANDDGVVRLVKYRISG
jgi:hypothetical protein